MYDNKKQINSRYLKKTNKYKKKIKNYTLFILILVVIIFVFFNINFQRFYEKQRNFTQHDIIKDSLPPKPKEKWKYIQKLENL